MYDLGQGWLDSRNLVLDGLGQGNGRFDKGLSEEIPLAFQWFSMLFLRNPIFIQEKRCFQ